MYNAEQSGPLNSQTELYLLETLLFYIKKGHHFRLRFLQAGLQISAAMRTIFFQETYFLNSLKRIKY
jgi:hypothetical protein